MLTKPYYFSWPFKKGNLLSQQLSWALKSNFKLTTSNSRFSPYSHAEIIYSEVSYILWHIAILQYINLWTVDSILFAFLIDLVRNTL